MPLNTPEGRDSKIRLSESKSCRFFSRVLESYHKAAASSRRETCRSYRIGCSQIELRFANPKGAALITPAFEHLEIQKRENFDLKIYLWDSASTGVKLPSVPWDVKDCIKKKQPWQYRGLRFNILFQPENGILNILDRHGRKACFWIQDFNELPHYEIGSPLLATLHWWFSSRHFQLIHAAALGRRKGGVLIVGKGGTGKSSTALSCLQSDLLYAGDDYCLVSSHKQPYVYSLYSTGKLSVRDVSLFPYLKPREYRSIDTKQKEKIIFFIHRSFPKKTLKKFPLKAVLIPELADDPSPCIKRISPVSGLLAAGPSTVFQLPGFEEQTFRNLSEVMKKIPCYKLLLVKDRDKNASALSRFLSFGSL